jgi:hypothetical protein
MMELQVILDFACCSCNESVSVTVRCEGKSLSQTARSVAHVNVPCPSCSTINRLSFEPNGTVRRVSQYTAPWTVLEPSIN